MFAGPVRGRALFHPEAEIIINLLLTYISKHLQLTHFLQFHSLNYSKTLPNCACHTFILRQSWFLGFFNFWPTAFAPGSQGAAENSLRVESWVWIGLRFPRWSTAPFHIWIKSSKCLHPANRCSGGWPLLRPWGPTESHGVIICVACDSAVYTLADLSLWLSAMGLLQWVAVIG